MFSQGSIDKMSIEDLVKTIRSVSYSVENHIDDPYDAYDYCNTLINLSENLRERIEDVMED